MNELLKTLLTISLTASVMILVVLGVRAMLAKRMNPVVIAALWAVVLIRLCVPITLESPVHVGDLIPEAPVVSEQTVEAEVPTVNVPQTDAVVNYNDTPTTVNNTILPQTEVVVQPKVVNMTQPTVWQRMVEIAESISLWSVLAVVWMLGAVVVLGNTLRQGVKFKCRLRKCERVTDGEIRHMVNELRRQLGIRQHVRVVVCNEIWAPAVFGCFRPVIILPIAFAQNVDKQTIRCILLHEMCHIKRRDILKSYVWLIAKALHWFNPLVWLAFRKTKDDIELCCDQMVIRHLDENSKFEYTQSLVDVFRISKRNAAYPVTVSLFENKAKLIERVMRMLKPNKRSKTALAVTILLTLLMTVTCFTTACQPAAKVEDALSVQEEPKVQDKESRQTVIHEVEETPSVPKYEAPEHWTDSFPVEDSVLKVNVEADIVMPNADVFRAYDVEPNGWISQETADRLLKVFFRDTPIYDQSSYRKEDFENILASEKRDYQAMLDGTYDFSKRDDFTDEETMIAETRAHIDELEKNIKEAKDGKIPMIRTLNTNEYSEQSIQGKADLGRDELAEIWICNGAQNTHVRFRNEGGYTEESYEKHEDYSSDKPLPGLAISESEAVTRADKLLDDLGLDDYALNSISIKRRWVGSEFDSQDGNPYSYVAVYTRVIDGIQMGGAVPWCVDNQDFMMNYSLEYSPEYIVITVDDDGIREFQWDNRFDVQDTIMDNVQLIPFDDIKSIIEENLLPKFKDIGKRNNDDKNDPFYNVTEKYVVTVDAIKLEFAKMPKGKDVDQQWLVPVWNVYATESVRHSYKNQDGDIVTDEFERRMHFYPLQINAIDGSVI